MLEWVFTEEQYNQLVKEWLEQGGKWNGRCLTCKYAIVLLSGRWFCRCRGGYE